MKANGFSYWFILALFLAVGALSWKIYFRSYVQGDSISIHHFPKVIGEWASEDLPVSDDEKAILETDNVFVRRYTNSNDEEVFLFIVYSENNRKVSHPPEICYTGGGASILSRDLDTVPSGAESPSIDVHRLKVERGRVMQIFAYWFKVGDSFTSSYWKQQGLIAYKSLLGQPASSALIRVSSTVKNNNDANATELIKKFGALIIPQIKLYLP